MRRNLHILVVVLLTVAVILVCRLFWLSLIEVPEEGERPVFHAGDRVLVNKTAYGLRLPFTASGYARWGYAQPMVGEWVAFNNPAAPAEVPVSRRDVFIGVCYAGPGDTLWIDAKGQILNAENIPERYRHVLKQVEIPRKGAYVAITPDNIRWYRQVISKHEGLQAEIKGDTLFVSGHAVKSYRFLNDYYWMTSATPFNHADSRLFGFVPYTHIIGRLSYVLYSWDSSRPWYARFRLDRMMMQVNHGYAPIK